MKKTTAIILVLIHITPLCFAQTQWRIMGAGSGEEGFLMQQTSGNAAEFTYTGPLTNQWFKITNNTTSYVPLCGDSDPLGQTIDLRQENDPAETGLQIRYAGKKEYFRVTLNVMFSSQKVSVERIEPPQSLYIMGGPFNKNTAGGNWLLEDAVEMERDLLNPFIFYYQGELRYNTFGEERGNIKFLISKSWGENYHPVGTTNIPLTQATKIRKQGVDTKWTIPSNRSGDGYYVITVNTLDETIKVIFSVETTTVPVKSNDPVNTF